MFIELASGTVLETNNADLWPEAKRLTKAEGKRRLKDESLAILRDLFPAGATVWTKVISVARSGMSRHIQVFSIKDNEPCNVSGHVARAIGERFNDKECSLVVGGCGMDMCFHTVYNLGHALFPDGFKCPGQGKCRSAEHSNGDRNYKPHLHKDGGYALVKRDM